MSRCLLKMWCAGQLSCPSSYIYFKFDSLFRQKNAEESCHISALYQMKCREESRNHVFVALFLVATVHTIPHISTILVFLLRVSEVPQFMTHISSDSKPLIPFIWLIKVFVLDRSLNLQSICIGSSSVCRWSLRKRWKICDEILHPAFLVTIIKSKTANDLSDIHKRWRRLWILRSNWLPYVDCYYRLFDGDQY